MAFCPSLPLLFWPSWPRVWVHGSFCKMVRGQAKSKGRSKSRYYLLNRQLALGRLRANGRRGGAAGRAARRTYAGIRQRAWRNLVQLRRGLAARAVVRRGVRRWRARRVAQRRSRGPFVSKSYNPPGSRGFSRTRGGRWRPN